MSSKSCWWPFLWPFARNIPARDSLAPDSTEQVRVLVVVEGIHDVEFLRCMSRTLNTHDSALPDLADWERRGSLIFIPYGGSDATAWSLRLSPLHVPEFHLLDREMPPVTDERRRAAAIVNARKNCRAAVTAKRSLENYLHSDCLREVRGIDIEVSDDVCLAEAVARRQSLVGAVPHRSRRKMKERAKRWLNTEAVERLTVERLRERDPLGETSGWLRAIAALANSP